MNMEDEDREKIVPFTEQQMLKVASVCNRYPNFELIIDQIEVLCEQGSSTEVPLTIKRDIDEADFESKEEYLQELKSVSRPVDASLYPSKKDEIWWVLIGDKTEDRVLSIKKINNVYNLAEINTSVAVDMDGYDQGAKELQVYFICDSYYGCDLEK